MTMTKKAKSEWVAALRSGKYKQGHQYLCGAETGAMCCLGVAYDVLVDGEWELEEGKYGIPLEIRDQYYPYETINDVEVCELPPKIMDKLGISDRVQRQLIIMNDGGSFSPSKSFSEIADWIEENL